MTFTYNLLVYFQILISKANILTGMHCTEKFHINLDYFDRDLYNTRWYTFTETSYIIDKAPMKRVNKYIRCELHLFSDSFL